MIDSTFFHFMYLKSSQDAEFIFIRDENYEQFDLRKLVYQLTHAVFQNKFYKYNGIFYV